MTPNFEAPNLDDISNEERAAFAKVFEQLQVYCGRKSAACKHRLAGRIDRAMTTEATCELIYKSLPEWARW